MLPGQAAHERWRHSIRRVERGDAQFVANARAMRALVAELARAHHRGRGRRVGSPARARHQARGKLLVRERIDLLLDSGTPFLELSALAAYGMYGGEVPARRASLPASVGSAAGNA